MKFESVLIVTYGRSGSTLLQGVLNSIPGCLVRGENNNFCYSLFQGYQALLATQEEHAKESTSSPTSPFFGSMLLDTELYRDDVAALVRRQLLANADPATVTCLGFKEVRYPGLVDLPLYLDFLEQILPDTAFLFLTRDLGSVVKSAWWKENDADVVRSKLARFEKIVRKWAGKRTNFFHLDYRDLADHSPRIGEMFAFLGAPYDAATVGAVIATPHSYPATASGKKEQAATGVAGKAAARPGGKMAAAAPVRKGVKAAPATEAADDEEEAVVRPPVQWQVVGKSATRVMFFDPLPRVQENPDVINLAGVLLPAEDLPTTVRLVLRQPGGGVREVAWGMPSPATGSRFPGDKRAGSARFYLPLTLAAGGGDLVLESTDGDAWMIAKIRVNAPGVSGAAP